MSDDTQHDAILGQLQEIHQKVTTLSDDLDRMRNVIDEIKSSQDKDKEDGYWTKKDVTEIKQMLTDQKEFLRAAKDADEKMEQESRETKRVFEKQEDKQRATEHDLRAIKEKIDALTRMVENMKK